MNLAPTLAPYATSAIRAFLVAHAGPASGADGVVVGVSGGIDSALCVRLAADALGPERVLAVLLPDAAFDGALAEEVRGYAAGLGVALLERPVDAVEAAVRPLLPTAPDAPGWGNVKARIRMLLLYAVARERGARVLGTGNKSELLLGYFTKWGDGGADLLPIGDLYKTSVRELAARLDLPAAVRARPPTAGLWPGQTDEGELGLPYEQLDPILVGLERLVPPDAIAAATGLPVATVTAIADRVVANRHKRRPVPIPKLGLRTVGIDWRD